MAYRVTLLENLPSRAAAAFEVTYTYPHHPAQTWPAHNVIPSHDTAVVTLDCAGPLMTPGASTRTLRGHYPTAPTEVDISISSVQPA